MRDRRPLLAAAALALAPLLSCASSPDGAWGEFSGAWSDAASDTKELFGKHFLSMDGDDPYATAPTSDDSGSVASRLLFDRGAPQSHRVPRQGQYRHENSAGDLWDWLLDQD
jgi:hypothetical protein